MPMVQSQAHQYEAINHICFLADIWSYSLLADRIVANNLLMVAKIKSALQDWININDNNKKVQEKQEGNNRNQQACNSPLIGHL